MTKNVLSKTGMKPKLHGPLNFGLLHLQKGQSSQQNDKTVTLGYRITQLPL